MKELNGIKYAEYSHEGADDYSVTVRVKVNPYVAGVFLNVLKDTLREICCGAYDKGDGIIDVDFIEVFPFNKALDKISEKTEIKYQFLIPEEI